MIQGSMPATPPTRSSQSTQPDNLLARPLRAGPDPGAGFADKLSAVKPLVVIPTRKTIPPHLGEAPVMKPFSWQYRAYVDRVRGAGAVPVHVAADPGEDELRAIFETVSGVVLCGGSDIHPRFYGQEITPGYNVYFDEGIDIVDITLAKWALEEDVPIFGICRGLQAMVVACGGTLCQDIRSEIGTEVEHGARKGVGTSYHDVSVSEGSRLAAVIGAGTHNVNSRHHQCMATPGDGLEVSARAADGVVEGLERRENRFAIGVQWHPEELDDAASDALFNTFVEQAQALRARRGG
jgi:putative glutamine amidotransferase